ncbi:histidine phosphatase family protein [archaeon]|nr:MAG: histidine phosphatase family protein [archaeon]
MKLIFVRHGETEENIQGVIQGHLPGRLSEKGKQQIADASKQLENEHIDYIYSSDLARAADTTKGIAKHHPNAPIEFVKELRERNYGEFTGKKKSEIDYQKWWDEIHTPHVRHKDAEALEEVYNRVSIFMDKILHKHKNQTVLLVGHGFMGKVLRCVLSNQPAEKVRDMGRVENAGVSIYDVSEYEKHELHVRTI